MKTNERNGERGNERRTERRAERTGETNLQTALLILGRDGVLGDRVEHPVHVPEEWRPQAGSLEAIARLHHAGLRIAVATNQPGIARGQLDMSTLVRIHRRMTQLIEQAGGYLDAVAVCPHIPAQNCNCRKPAPGMILDLLARFDLPASRAVVVGDSLEDMEAARAAGCHGWLVRTGLGSRALDGGHLPAGTVVVDDLGAAADRLLSAQALTADSGTARAQVHPSAINVGGPTP